MPTCAKLSLPCLHHERLLWVNIVVNISLVLQVRIALTKEFFKLSIWIGDCLFLVWPGRKLILVVKLLLLRWWRVVWANISTWARLIIGWLPRLLQLSLSHLVQRTIVLLLRRSGLEVTAITLLDDGVTHLPHFKSFQHLSDVNLVTVLCGKGTNAIFLCRPRPPQHHLIRGVEGIMRLPAWA